MNPTIFDEPVTIRCPIRGILVAIDSAEEAVSQITAWPEAEGDLGLHRRARLLQCKEAARDRRTGGYAREAFAEAAEAAGYLYRDRFSEIQSVAI